MATKIQGQDGYLYHCVPAISLPVTHEVQISSSSSSQHGETNGVVGVATEQNGLGEMINILTPILNVDEKQVEHHHHHHNHHHNHHHHHLFNGEAVIKAEYILHEDVHTAIKLEHDSIFQKLNGVNGGGGDGGDGSGGSAGSGSPETEIKRTERLQKDIFRKKMARLRESDDQRVERLKKDRIRKKRARQNESHEQRQRRLEKDRVRIQKRRAVETDDERQRRLEKNRISKRKARLKENSLMKDLHM
ncbi:hypothetical protein TYRP_007611 [Tyrophagus putrescentiae]|nr:hypothetical protein TYRP_007611 [Tyrophagus putrescentiae]